MRLPATVLDRSSSYSGPLVRGVVGCPPAADTAGIRSTAAIEACGIDAKDHVRESQPSEVVKAGTCYTRTSSWYRLI